MIANKEIEAALYSKNRYDDQEYWRIADRTERLYRIIVDPINCRLIDYETESVIYAERHDGGIDLADVLAGRQMWENGDKFTIEDFLRECLEIYNFIVLYINGYET